MGTFGNDRFSPEQTAEAVYGAIKAGYRLFDCAAAYGNEKDIGRVFGQAFSEESYKEKSDDYVKSLEPIYMERDITGSMCDKLKRTQTGLPGYLYGALAISLVSCTGAHLVSIRMPFLSSERIYADMATDGTSGRRWV